MRETACCPVAVRKQRIGRGCLVNVGFLNFSPQYVDVVANERSTGSVETGKSRSSGFKRAMRAGGCQRRMPNKRETIAKNTGNTPATRRTEAAPHGAAATGF